MKIRSGQNKIEISKSKSKIRIRKTAEEQYSSVEKPSLARHGEAVGNIKN